MQTRQTRVIDVRTDLTMDSEAAPELVAAVVRNAKNGCFAEQALKHPVDMTETVALNGQTVRLGAIPGQPGQWARD